MSYQQLKNKKEGFTIIEVLIVLAIAGLIMLIVFLAVPALQRSQRNNARNSEGARVAALMTECVANYNGRVDQCNTLARLGINIAADFKEFSNVQIGATAGTGSTTVARINAKTNAASGTGFICAADNTATATGAGNRDFAVTYRLEPTNIQRCIDSQ